MPNSAERASQTTIDLAGGYRLPMRIYVDHNVKFSCAFALIYFVSDSIRCLCSLSTECGSSPVIETEFPAGICVEKGCRTQRRDVSSTCTSTWSESRFFVPETMKPPKKLKMLKT